MRSVHRSYIRSIRLLTALCLLLAGILSLCMSPVRAEAPRSPSDIVKDLCVFYGAYGESALPEIEMLLRELDQADPKTAGKWTRILKIWRSVQNDLMVHYDVLPDGLLDTDALCLIALGFRLNPDGSIQPELEQRLKVVQRSAQKYPNALIICTGGGTATNAPQVTEAGQMAKWLIEHGIDSSRVIVEDTSMTTAQNARNSLRILAASYPQVTQLAIISSDYHIATGTLLFDAQAVLLAPEGSAACPSVVSNAACRIPDASLSNLFQAGALIELSGDIDTAYELYYNTYPIRKLPARDE